MCFDFMQSNIELKTEVTCREAISLLERNPEISEAFLKRDFVFMLITSSTDERY